MDRRQGPSRFAIPGPGVTVAAVGVPRGGTLGQVLLNSRSETPSSPFRSRVPKIPGFAYSAHVLGLDFPSLDDVVSLIECGLEGREVEGVGLGACREEDEWPSHRYRERVSSGTNKGSSLSQSTRHRIDRPLLAPLAQARACGQRLQGASAGLGGRRPSCTRRATARALSTARRSRGCGVYRRTVPVGM